MKKRLYTTTLLIAVFLVASAGNAFAQQDDNADANTSIEVLAALSLTNNADIDFGQVFNNGPQTATLDPRDGSVTGNSPQGNPTVGKFTASGQDGEKIDVTFSDATLNGTGSDLTFTPDVYGSTTDEGATATTSGSEVTSGSSVTMSASGDYYFWVGGQIPISDGQQQGEYTGTFTLNVAYTNM
jgi:hypothetical protein